MNPVRLLLVICVILFGNYLFALAACGLAFARGYYTGEEFLDVFLVTTAFIGIISGNAYRFFSENKEKDFSRITKRFNFIFVSVAILICLFSSAWFDLGIYFSLIGVLSETGTKLYFVFYELMGGAALGTYLLPDIWLSLKKMKKDELI
ncbi:hypothetical protein Xen7305DRAFT_00008940 [Xenococcus sp. PCC 7305]|uniref:hypothetical protein n=1 Tax=Xenococcus sp. PCC 7305 TaxID=102125 RepID=UPI0002ACFC34|nr:hypothetical protein [Xenococcus sp. PCC 7305]ELS01192.1 hypothetical protein Xen7305DRAFT_00008940 [Xenococcus sp. PCC 7305]